ncbi:hypothetical protein IKS57_00605 [bacterium]|nr:hypothetical protein [bacterium]
MINDYKQRIISEHETLFKINFYLVVSANSKEELYEKNNAYKSFFKSDLIELKEVNYDYFFINLFEQYKNINKSNLSNIYLTNTQLTLG